VRRRGHRVRAPGKGRPPCRAREPKVGEDGCAGGFAFSGLSFFGRG
jgi:hypothetical protein